MTDLNGKSQIVLIHGLYMRPIAMRPMGLWFESKGYATSYFGYRTTSESLTLNVEKLAKHIDAIEADQVHLVCHSLGGLLARAYLEFGQHNPKIKKLVTIGTPHQGAAIARWLTANKLGALLGQSADKGLLESSSHWPLKIPLGSIAGEKRIGLLPLISDTAEPSDGTVYVSETHLRGETDHIVLPYSHTQMLVTIPVFEQGLHFLKNNQFHHEND